MDEIEPDTKDWTWVLARPCPDCGLAVATLGRDDIAPVLRHCAQALAAAVRGQNARQRPAPTVWSPLEYGCHVRDVFAIFDRRLQLMLDEDDPLFANWDQDDTAREERYELQDPVVVADQLERGVEPLAARFESLTDGQWRRPGRRSDGAAFTVDTFAQYLAHDPVHHLYDVTGEQVVAGGRIER
jgi:DinB superfamily